MQILVKIGLFAAELLHIFHFQNGGRPPSWIWYDVIADNPIHIYSNQIYAPQRYTLTEDKNA